MRHTTHTSLLHVAVLLLGGVCLPAAARGDVLSATLGEPLREVSHAVDLRVRDGVATFVVHRVFANPGVRHDEACLLIELPPGAAATGLRIRGRDRWYDGELLEAERAAELYRELTGIGPHSPRDPALLWWVWPDELTLQVFPVPPDHASTVEYTLTLPTRYAAGRYRIPYPFAAPGLAAPVVRAFPEAPGTVVRVDGRLAAPEEPIVLRAAADTVCPTPPGADRPLATCAQSAVQVEDDRPVAAARVAVALRHTYRGDLTLWLVTPDGRWETLLGEDGGSENDIHATFPVTFDPPAPARGPWRLVVADRVAQDAGTLDRWSLELAPEEGGAIQAVARDTPVFVPDAPDEDGAPAGLATIELDAPPIDTLAARYDRLVVAEDVGFARLEWDVAAELRPLPRAPSVVFVVDASHSVGTAGIAGQLALAQAYLAHVPDAAVEVVAFRRRAERVFGRFEPRAAVTQLAATESAMDEEAVADDETAEAVAPEPRLAPGNGSALEEGLLLAVAALADRPAPRRVVALTDALLRSRFALEDGLAPLAGLEGDDVVHVVLPSVDTCGVAPTDERDDEHALAPLADRHGGVLLRVRHVCPPDPAAHERLALGLVRPVRIDGFTVEGLAADAPAVVDEGTGFRWLNAVAAPPAELTLRGRIWAARFEQALTAPDEPQPATAAFVFSHDLHGGLTREQQLQVAFLGGAVSPVTSYLAIEPGVRPSRVGIERRAAFGARRVGRAARIAMGGAGAGRPPDLARLLRPGWERCARAHPPAPGWTLELAIETTRSEVVDVVAPEKDDPLAACVVEEAWALRLGAVFREERRTHRLRLPL